jgi:hypothetical protein
MTEIIRTAVRAFSPITEVVTVAQSPQDRHRTRIISPFTTTLFVVPGTAKVSRDVPVRAWPSGCFSNHTDNQNEGRKSGEIDSAPHFRFSLDNPQSETEIKFEIKFLFVCVLIIDVFTLRQEQIFRPDKIYNFKLINPFIFINTYFFWKFN